MNHAPLARAVGRWLKPVMAGILAASAASVGAAGSAPEASAAPISQCAPHLGTIVAVDFEHWGGPIVRGCGVGQRSGYDLLHAAGFTTAGDQHDGPAFICRLGNAAFHAGTQYPTPGQEDCVLTPPAAAHWSYWLAPAGQNHWTYSQLGAMSEVPKPGEVELWIFGAHEHRRNPRLRRATVQSGQAARPQPSARQPAIASTHRRTPRQQRLRHDDPPQRVPDPHQPVNHPHRDQSAGHDHDGYPPPHRSRAPIKSSGAPTSNPPRTRLERFHPGRHHTDGR